MVSVSRGFRSARRDIYIFIQFDAAVADGAFCIERMVPWCFSLVHVWVIAKLVSIVKDLPGSYLYLAGREGDHIMIEILFTAGKEIRDRY